MVDLHGLVNDGNIWLALIAINMTIIGLTSLAETKKVIGIDYGKFLIKSYVVLGKIRMYSLLIIFAVVNTLSLFSMFVEVYWFRAMNFSVLVLSLVFAIYYFFRYILVENEHVREQIYMHELLGLYYKSADNTTIECDILARIKSGWRTSKMISSNVIEYFNTFSTDSYNAFVDLFGPTSILYSTKPKIIDFWKVNFGLEPFDYTRGNSKYVHISHEFFQVFRYSDLQVKWIIEIIKLFNGEYSKDCPELRLDNIMRVFTHINRFGHCENLYSYKFMEYTYPYVLKAFQNDDLISAEDGYRAKKELCAIREVAKYTFKTLDTRQERVFYQIAMGLFVSLIMNGSYCQYTTGKERLDEVSKVFCGTTDLSKRFLSELVYKYMTDAGIKIDDFSALNLPVMAELKDDNDILKVQNYLF